jgi:hypothetical protein
MALEVIGRQNDSRWCPHVYALFRRVAPDERHSLGMYRKKTSIFMS